MNFKTVCCNFCLSLMILSVAGQTPIDKNQEMVAISDTY